MASITLPLNNSKTAAVPNMTIALPILPSSPLGKENQELYAHWCSLFLRTINLLHLGRSIMPPQNSGDSTHHHEEVSLLMESCFTPELSTSLRRLGWQRRHSSWALWGFLKTYFEISANRMVADDTRDWSDSSARSAGITDKQNATTPTQPDSGRSPRDGSFEGSESRHAESEAVPSQAQVFKYRDVAAESVPDFVMNQRVTGRAPLPAESYNHSPKPNTVRFELPNRAHTVQVSSSHASHKGLRRNVKEKRERSRERTSRPEGKNSQLFSSQSGNPMRSPSHLCPSSSDSQQHQRSDRRTSRDATVTMERPSTSQHRRRSSVYVGAHPGGSHLGGAEEVPNSGGKSNMRRFYDARDKRETVRDVAVDDMPGRNSFYGLGYNQAKTEFFDAPED